MVRRFCIACFSSWLRVEIIRGFQVVEIKGVMDGVAAYWITYHMILQLADVILSFSFIDFSE